MVNVIDSDDVRTLVGKLARSPEGFEREKLRARLDNLADGIGYGDTVLEYESMVDRDDVEAMLAGYGSDGFSRYMYGD